MKINKIVLLISFLVFVGSLSAQVVVIANKSVVETTISNTMAKDIYSLDVQQWSNGKSIKVFDIKQDNAVKSSFYGFISSNASNLKKIWLRAKLSGEGTPPTLLNTEEEILTEVANTPDAIGYISSAKVTNAVKVLATIK